MEEETGKPFGEVVRELRLQLKPNEIPIRLGVSRSFLYENFGWAMDKIGYVERLYGMTLGELIATRRSEGISMEAMASEWGLAVTTLYKHLRRGTLSAPPAAGGQSHQPARGVEA